ncbi:entericidin A/B family lipoprotein [Parapedomonas caeni]|jgi:entericidin B
MMKKTIVTLMLTAVALSAAACNTVQGVGKDIESVGRKGEQVLDDAKK